MALDKLPLLLALSVSYYIAMTPPNPPASRKEISKYPPGSLMSRHAVSFFTAPKILLLTCIFCEMIVIISTHYATTLVRIAPVTNSISCPAPATTTTFLVGFFLTLSGACVRWLSYRALGPLFTFELSIRDQHKLITTGPYSIVRHPSYTGTLLFFPGILLCVFGPGSWIYECGWLDLVSVRIFAGVAIAVSACIIVITLSRMSVEEKTMHKEFGQQWDEWAKKVPYRLVPGIF
ncbi:hypothetical protein BT96DRAFT_887343 [Gymnopus androsaceus JB14]|uniref:Protein-S-isoprenylcysteine O-methyltransferase n=1 Tax=Gymnopus androsaceus JB14 TaxID=1447944 RepID=A0A6A4H6H6_9AGAR|nr:hypothetical protein BT96DRAFT_887343 [Gymnopus androsaceus JB14]